jgi:manganese/iron transport system ATP-binding protein/manganese/zinc/iron transport system ATP- binding protein
VHGPARIGVVPQTERSRLDFPVSALDVALMGTISTLPWWRRPSRADRRRAREALAAVALERHVDQSFGALSGGQRQRVLVARALVQDAPLLLFDEPYTGLDARSAELLDGLLAQLAEGGRAILVATHDVEQARRWDRVLCLNRRQVAFGDPSEALGLDVLEATYGGAVVELSDRRGVLPPHHHDHR